MDKKAIVYIRVSTDEQKNGNGLEMQEHDCRAYAQKLGFTSFLLAVDEGISGTIPFEDRPGGEIVLGELKNGRCQDVIVYKLDRLSRPPENEEEIIELLLTCRLIRKFGANIHAVYDGGEQRFDTVGQLKLLLDGKKASEERRDTRIRLSHGRRNKVKVRNKYVGNGATPFGYRKEGKREESRLVIYEPEAYWVREIYKWYTSGLSLRQVARLLDENNAPRTSRRKLNFTAPTTVRWFITNPIYKGLYVWKSKDPDTHKDDPIEIELPELAIVNPEIWEAAQKRLEINVSIQKRNQRTPYLLSGFFRCGTCGGAMGGHSHLKRNNRHYHCGNKGRLPPHEECPNHHTRLDAEKVEYLVWDWLIQLITDENNLLLGLQRIASQTADELSLKQSRYEDIIHLLEDAQDKIRRASEELLKHDNEIVLGTLRDKIKQLSSYAKSLAKEKESLEIELSQSVASEETQARILEMARQIRKRLPGGDFKAKRELMVRLGLSVVAFFDGDNRWVEVSCRLSFANDRIFLGETDDVNSNSEFESSILQDPDRRVGEIEGTSQIRKMETPDLSLHNRGVPVESRILE